MNIIIGFEEGIFKIDSKTAIKYYSKSIEQTGHPANDKIFKQVMAYYSMMDRTT